MNVASLGSGDFLGRRLAENTERNVCAGPGMRLAASVLCVDLLGSKLLGNSFVGAA